MKYDIVIGLEIHAELNTNTKLFCGCKNDTSALPNENCCPICLGMPDAPAPKVNKSAVEKTILAGIALGCEINDVAMFERKHYFYPDLPAGYQVSQLERPICLGGGLKLKSGKFIRLNRIHLEEDAGKLLHDEANGVTLIDLNRCSTPLNEIVTEPDISNAEEAVEFLEELRSRLIFAGVANCKMEEGGMRCDVNISLKPRGEKKFGNRVEMKNLYSFKMVVRAIEYETKRQAELLDAGKAVLVQTRKWNDNKGISSAMRSKEQATDYRYYLAPDLPAINITREDVVCIEKSLPKLAHELREKFVKEYGLPEYDADILTRTRECAGFYQDCLKLLAEPKKISNWIMVDLLKKMKDMATETLPISPEHFTQIIKMTEDKTTTKTVGLQLMDEVIKTGEEPMGLAKKLGLLTTITTDQIRDILIQLKKDNPRVAADFASDPSKVLRFIIGQVMKQTRGQAKSDEVERIIAEVF